MSTRQDNSFSMSELILYKRKQRQSVIQTQTVAGSPILMKPHRSQQNLFFFFASGDFVMSSFHPGPARRLRFALSRVLFSSPLSSGFFIDNVKAIIYSDWPGTPQWLSGICLLYEKRWSRGKCGHLSLRAFRHLE